MATAEPDRAAEPLETMDAQERADTEWVIEHWPELCDAFPLEWIAIANKEVIGHGFTRKDALREGERTIEMLGPGTGRVKPRLFFVERTADRVTEH